MARNSKAEKVVKAAAAIAAETPAPIAAAGPAEMKPIERLRKALGLNGLLSEEAVILEAVRAIEVRVVRFDPPRPQRQNLVYGL